MDADGRKVKHECLKVTSVEINYIPQVRHVCSETARLGEEVKHVGTVGLRVDTPH